MNLPAAPRAGSVRQPPNGLCGIVDSAADLEVVGEAGAGREAVALVQAQRPDVVLMDIRMPDMDGIEATRQITESEAASATRVLVLTTFDLDEYVYAALHAGASGFLLKDTPPRDLLDGIRRRARRRPALTGDHQEADRAVRRPPARG
jgi:DNA-binding NarL/FixJ family response regulator